MESVDSAAVVLGETVHHDKVSRARDDAGVRNCLTFALSLYLRRRRRGRHGYLVMRRSRWGRFPHVLYAELRRSGTLRVVHYVPRTASERKCPPPSFEGRSKWGDL